MIGDVLGHLSSMGFNATVDFPTMEYYQEQLAANPSTKVI